MRRLTAIAVLFFLLCPWGTPILSALSGHSEDNLPACCRRNGRHHCMMSMAERRQLFDHDRQVAPPVEKCPCAPPGGVAVHNELFAIPASRSILTDFIADSARFARMRALPSIAETDSLHKRGPPSGYSSL
jgi:hypothetical protein